MRNNILIFCGLLICLACNTCKQLFKEPSVYIPYKIPDKLADGWETASLAVQGMRLAPIDSMTKLIATDHYKNIHSVVIIKNNKLVYENYFNGYDRNMVHNLYSASKSFTSALVGVAIDKGFIPDTNTPIMPYFPEYSSYFEGPDKQNITIRHLLTMSSGLECNDWDPRSPAQEDKLYKQKDVLQGLFKVPMVYKPDSATQYCSAGVIALAHIISKTTGQNYTDFAKKSLLEPLGIEQYRWTFREKGRIDRPDQIFLKTRDMCKFGQLYLDGGNWKGQQLISKTWVEASWKPRKHLGNGEYGFLWWLFPGSINGEKVYVYAAKGNGGQYVFVMPSLQLVVAITGGNLNSSYSEQGHALLYKYIIPANYPGK